MSTAREYAPMGRIPDGGSFDAIVVGTGFGGLGAALRLAERGARVSVFERAAYPGGCACTFRHGGDEFEGGATLFSGFDEGQLFRRWIDVHGMDVDVERLEHPVELRAASGTIRAHRDRDAMLREFQSLPGAPVDALGRFFALQAKVAGALWPTLDDTDLLPPLTPKRALRHAKRLLRYAPLGRLVGKPLWSVLERFGLTEFQPLVTWLDAQCQITVQCGVREAEAPFALAALDFHHRGAVHVRGGIGRLAWGMVRAIEALGGEVHFSSAVKHARQADGGWAVRAGRVLRSAPHLVCNMLPHDVSRLTGQTIPALDKLTARVETGWSACVLFCTVRPPAGATDLPLHLELVDDEAAPFVDGNHIFMSIGASGEGVQDQTLRRATISTHVDARRIRSLSPAEQQRAVEDVQDRMRSTLRRLAPEWSRVVRELTGSPRTYGRWTGRADGFVGGIPRRAGLAQYRDVLGLRLPEGLHLVGDSVFPGQSTLATAAGGARVAETILGTLPVPVASSEERRLPEVEVEDELEKRSEALAQRAASA